MTSKSTEATKTLASELPRDLMRRVEWLFVDINGDLVSLPFLAKYVLKFFYSKMISNVLLETDEICSRA